MRCNLLSCFQAPGAPQLFGIIPTDALPQSHALIQPHQPNDHRQHIVAESTGCSDLRLSEELYQEFQRPEAWRVAPGAHAALACLRSAGVRLAVVSNFDTRLRPILDGLGLSPLFDEVVVSAEVGAEKPNPVLFEAACASLRSDPALTVHVGDDRRNDLCGARDAGCHAWLWGLDVVTFPQLANRVLHGVGWDEDEDDDVLGGERCGGERQQQQQQ